MRARPANGTPRFTGAIAPQYAASVIHARRVAKQQLWAKACEWEGIAQDEFAVIFSDENPFAALYDTAAQLYFATIKEYQAGGYVGLMI